MRTPALITAFCIYFLSRAATGAVTEYTNNVQWQNAAGAFTTITFTELPTDTLVTTQYAPLGVTFTDGSDYTMYTESFVNDQHGLNGALDNISLSFSQPMQSIAVDYPGAVKFYLYFQGQLFYESTHFFVLGPSGTGGFAGLISEQPFDSVVIYDSGVFIDDLHFGPAIPAPAALALMGLAAAFARRRGRTN